VIYAENTNHFFNNNFFKFDYQMTLYSYNKY